MPGSDTMMFGGLWLVWMVITIVTFVFFLRGMNALVQIAKRLESIERIMSARDSLRP